MKGQKSQVSSLYTLLTTYIFQGTQLVLCSFILSVTRRILFVEYTAAISM